MIQRLVTNNHNTISSRLEVGMIRLSVQRNAFGNSKTEISKPT